MIVEEVIDYAMPLMKIERFAKEIHDLCLHYKYEEAREQTLHLLAEARVLQHTLTIMNEKEQR
jgi:hypothetical protein